MKEFQLFRNNKIIFHLKEGRFNFVFAIISSLLLGISITAFAATDPQPEQSERVQLKGYESFKVSIKGMCFCIEGIKI